jgi:outer membrane protein TolC
MACMTARAAPGRRGNGWGAAFGLCGAFGAFALAGCATFSSDGGFDAVANATRSRLGKEILWSRSAEERERSAALVAKLLAQPLSVDDAVQIALLNNSGLQAAFEMLGISEADLVRAGRLPNPSFTLRHASAGGVYDIEETVSVSVLGLLTGPYRHAIEKRRFQAAQDAAAATVLELAARARRAYFSALAARESARYLETMKEAAQTGAELARRMRAAGNWNRIDEARQQSFSLGAALAWERARAAEEVALENLAAILGLAGDVPELKLAERLPDLPPGIEPLPPLEQAALDNRVDLKLMRDRIDALARDLKLTKATRFVNVLDAGAARIRQGAAEEPYESGYEVRLEVPLFDGGETRVRKAQALYTRAVDELGEAAIMARAEVRTAYARYRALHEIALRQRDEALPLRRTISAEDLKRYDAAEISVFDLLADARSEMSAVNEFIESERDFWIAKSELDAALMGGGAPGGGTEPW